MAATSNRESDMTNAATPRYPARWLARAVGVVRLLATVAGGLAVAPGCAAVTPRVHTAAAASTRMSVWTVNLHGSSLELHVARPVSDLPPGSFVLYASGDGGGFGAAVEMFRTIAANGYPTVGFSSRAFLKLERPAHAALNARQLAADYAAILSEGRRVLGLPPETAVILTGWSRGAALAMIAASEPALSGHTRGVVAIGLSPDEDLAVTGDGDEDNGGPVAGASMAHAPFDLYDRLRQAHPWRCAVIQSSGDSYLPAAGARLRFGADTPDRRLYTVQARNHRFSGGQRELGAALLGAIAWVDQLLPDGQ